MTDKQQQELGNLASTFSRGIPGTEVTPHFGDWFRGIYASESNPQRDGMFVRAGCNTGRLNRGVWWEFTDGRGAFWRMQPSSVVTLRARDTDDALRYRWLKAGRIARVAGIPNDKVTGDDLSGAIDRAMRSTAASVGDAQDNAPTK